MSTSSLSDVGVGGIVETVFLGTSTVLVTDGVTSVLVDGYLSRPSFLRLLLGRVAPHSTRIDASLARAGIDRLALVAVSHSHVDHALDSAVIAHKTGARLAGSESTLMIARGLHFEESEFDLLEPGISMSVGSFTVTPIEANHSKGDRAPGEITVPLVPPAKATAYKTGGCFDFHIAHSTGTVLVHPSANFIPGALDGYPADVIYLGAGFAGLEDEAWRIRYWDETVVATGATTVLPVHWDRFWRSLSRPMRPFGPRLDDLDATLGTWMTRANASGIDLRLPTPWVRERLES